MLGTRAIQLKRSEGGRYHGKLRERKENWTDRGIVLVFKREREKSKVPPPFLIQIDYFSVHKESEKNSAKR